MVTVINKLLLIVFGYIVATIVIANFFVGNAFIMKLDFSYYEYIRNTALIISWAPAIVSLIVFLP